MKITKALSSLAVLGILAGAVALPERGAFAANMNYSGDWAATTVYPAGRTITFNNRLYYSLKSSKAAHNRGYQPDKFPALWKPVGTIANTLLSGIGAPDNSMGQGGDYYIDYQNSRLFGPKNSVSGWSADSVALAGTGGAKGDTGSQGPAGPQGSVGAKGDKGDIGDKGSKGDKGDKGDTGAVGPAGATGPAPMIVDANGVVVGAFVNGDAWVDTPAGKRSLNHINPDGYTGGRNHKIFYATNDCSGTPYAEPNSGPNSFDDITHFPGMVPSGVLVPNDPIAPFVGRFFYLVGGGEVSFTAQSFIKVNGPIGTCFTNFVNVNHSGSGPQLGVMNVNWQAPIRVQ